MPGFSRRRRLLGTKAYPGNDEGCFVIAMLIGGFFTLGITWVGLLVYFVITRVGQSSKVGIHVEKPNLASSRLNKEVPEEGKKTNSYQRPEQNKLTKEQKKQAIRAWKLEEKKLAEYEKSLRLMPPQKDERTTEQKLLDELTYKFGKKTALEKLMKGYAGGNARPALTKKPITSGPKSGWVYVIRDNSTGLYKIGRTKHLDQRMRQLGVGKTATLIQKKQVSDSYAVEKDAHKRYKNSRLPQTEYFKLNSPPTI